MININENIQGEGKGGGGSSPVEAPDSLRARQTAKSLIGICEGPIDGIAELYFNDTNVDQFESCGYDTRNGESTQTAVPLFSNISSTVDVGIELVGPGGNIYGYITTATTSNITFQHPVTLPAGNNTISIKLPNGKTETRTILGTTQEITWTSISVSPFSQAPAAGSAYSIKASTSLEHPVAQDVTSIDIDEVLINLQLDALVNIDDSGNANGYTVSFRVETRPSPLSAYSTHSTWTIKGKTTKPYSESLSVQRPDNAIGKIWGIRITRITKPDPNTKVQSTSRWSSSNQLIHKTLTYDNTALAAIYADAKSTGGAIPRASFDVRGLKIKVPHNYNASTRVYTGTFNGSLSTAIFFTDNPAYCLLDLLTNDRYGMGIPTSRIDIYSFYNAGVYCDELVTYVDESGDTQTLPRFTYNNIIQSYEDAFTLVQAIASCMRGFLVDIGGLLTVIQDRPTTANQLFTNANVIDGIFEYNSNQLEERYTTVNVTYNEPADRYLQKVISVPSSTDHTYDSEIAKYQYNSTDLAAVGCTDAGQAYRLGKYYLDNSLLTGENVQFKTSIQHAFVQPGDVILISDSHYSGENVGGRIISATSNSITLDRNITLYGGTNTISVYLPDGTISTKNISETNGSYTTINISSPFSQVPSSNSPYIITLSSSSRPPRSFRVSKVTLMASDESNLLEISGSLYDASKYTRVDSSFTIPIQEFYDQVQYVVPKPHTITKKIIQVLDPVNNISRNDILIDWLPGDSKPYTYKIKYSYESGDFTELETTATNFSIIDAQIGNYEIWIYAQNVHGALSEGILVDITYQSSNIETSPLPLEDQNTLLSPMTDFWVKGTTNVSFNAIDLYLSWSNPNTITTQDQSVVKQYIIETWNSTYSTLLNTYTILPSSSEFTYSFVMNRNDYGTPSRNVYMKLYAEDANQRRSNPVSKTFTNPVPELQNWEILPSVGCVYISIDPSPDTDIETYLIYRSTQSNFTKDDTTLVYAGKEKYINISAENGILYYYAYSIADTFGREGSNVSTEISTTAISVETDEYNYENLTFIPNHNAPQNVINGVDSGYSLNAIYWDQFKAYKNGVLLNTINSGTYTFNSVNGPTMFLYYLPNNSTLQSGYILHDIIAAGGRILATYKGGSDLAFNEGKAFISGDQLLAGTVGANTLVSNTAVITTMAQIDNVIQSADYVYNENDPLNPIHSGWRIDKNGYINAANINIYNNNQLVFSAGNYLGKLNNVDTSTVVSNAEAGVTKNKTFSQIAAPTTGMIAGDLWIDTDDSNKLYRYDGVAWQTMRDTGIALALQNATNAQATADGKIDSFFQTTAPVSGMALGDLWFDTDDSNKLYRYNGTSWQLARDDGISSAISAASAAQSTANTKVVTFFQTTTPTSTTIGDLWYNSNDSLLKRWNGSSWVIVSNAYNNTNQLTDGANLGQTAAWTSVTNRPTSLSTLNSTDGLTLVNANSNASSAINAVNDIASDSKFTPVEKSSVRNEWNAIAAEKSLIVSQAATVSVSYTTYTNSFQALANYLNAGVTWSTGIPTWISDANLSVTTDIVGSTFRSNFEAYYTARVNIINSIETAINNTAVSKARTYYSSTTPTGMVAGDLWYNTSTALLKRYDGSIWYDVSNNYTNSNQLTDGAGWATTATWVNITGVGKPADYATKNTIYNQTTAPTGGTYSTGDLWVDTDSNPTTIAQWNGSSWGIVSNYTNNTNQLLDGGNLGQTALWNGVTGTGKPADNATVNNVTYSATGPVSPVNGDIWVDIGVNPNIAKVRVAGAWQFASNYTTNTNQLTDGANLGQTALWTSVTNRPTSLSTLNATDGTTLTNASTNATNAINAVNDIASDSKFTPVEKSSVRMEWNSIAVEKPLLVSQAATVSVSSTTYTNAFQALANYLNAGSTWSTGIPSWISDANLSVTTDIVGSTFRTNFESYYTARVNLINAVETAINAIAVSKARTYYSLTAPTGMVSGDLWYDQTNLLLKRYNGSTWATIGVLNNNTSGSGTPTGGVDGDSWFDTSTNLMWYKSGGVWKKVIPQLTSANITTFMASAAIGNTQIGTAAIGTANIIDANITNAKIDRLSANKLQVVEGDIANLAVSTLKIAGNAVVVPVALTLSGTYSIRSTVWTQISSISIDMSGSTVNSRVNVFMFGGVKHAAAAGTVSVYGFRLKKNGVVIMNEVNFVSEGYYAGDGSGTYWEYSAKCCDCYVDTLNTAATYTLEVQGGFINAQNCTGIGNISLFGAKSSV